MKLRILTYTLVIISLMFAIESVWAQPVAPTRDLTSKSKVKKETNLDLPYQPKDIEDDEKFESLIDEPGDDQTQEKKVTIDWSHLPFIPSKNPQFPPAKDPEI